MPLRADWFWMAATLLGVCAYGALMIFKAAFDHSIPYGIGRLLSLATIATGLLATATTLPQCLRERTGGWLAASVALLAVSWISGLTVLITFGVGLLRFIFP